MLLRLLLFATLFPCACLLCAQPGSFDHLDIRDGLSQNSAKCIFQDSQGFIWIGTEDGLNRYDGREFVIYRNVQGDPSSIGESDVRRIHEDEAHDLLITHARQISRYTRNTHRFASYLVPGFPRSRIYNSVYCDGTLFLTMSEGLLAFRNNTFNWIYRSKGTYGIALGQPHEVLFSDSSQVYALSTLSLRIRPLFSCRFKVFALTYNMQAHEAVAAGTQNGLVVYRDRHLTDYTKKADALLGKRGDFYCVLIDKRQQVWAGGNDMLVRISGDELIQFRSGTGRQDALSKNNVDALLEDRSGLIWIGTYGGGVNIYNPFKGPFHTISHTENAADGLSSDFILSFTEDAKGQLWIGTDGDGIDCWNRQRNSFSHYTTVNAGLKGEEAFTMCMYQNYLLLGTSYGLEIFDPAKGKVFRSLKVGTTLGEYVKCILVTRSGQVYFGNVSGLYLLGKDLQTITPVSALKDMRVRSLSEDDDGTIWIGTGNGLIKWKDGRTTHYLDTGKPGRTGHHISCIANTGSFLWLGSMGNGMIRFNKADGSCRYYTTREGLPNDLVYGILEDQYHHLWLSTNNGLSQFDPRSGRFRNFNVNDGLQSNEFNGGACYKGRGNMLYFGGVNGFSYFNAGGFRPAGGQPELRITQLSLPDHELNIDSVNALPELELPYTSNYLTFKFAALEYAHPRKIRYRYMLEGHDKDWVNAHQDNIARYNKLPAGDYVFRVMSTNGDDQWMHNEASLRLSITPPFWETKWFLLVAAFLVLTAVWTGVSLRIRFIQKRAAEKSAVARQLADLELKALRAQMNPHFIFNALNSIQDFILNNNARDASKYLSRFAKLIRMILDNAETAHVTLARKIDFLKLYIDIEALRFGNDFDYVIHVADDVNTYETEIPNMLIQPFVENAIWHGLMHKPGDRRLELNFRKERGRFLLCEVIDNGVGRKEAAGKRYASHDSKALRITQERMDLLNFDQLDKAVFTITDLTNEHGHATGTMVSIYIPVQFPSL